LSLSGPPRKLLNAPPAKCQSAWNGQPVVLYAQIDSLCRGGELVTTTQESAVAVELITVVIDGFEVSVPKGTLVIRAAEKLGIQIPRFCDHPLLDPVGACRQCLVDIEINGRAFPKPQASCTIPVEPNMVVKTQLTSPVADKAQKGVMELADLVLINKADTQPSAAQQAASSQQLARQPRWCCRAATRTGAA